MRDPNPSRRSFLMHGTAAVAATAAFDLVQNAHAAGSDKLKVGLIGAGGRGTGAAEQALTADKNTCLYAIADAFDDRVAESLSALKSSPVADRIDTPQDRQYSGFDAYKHVIDQCDVVLLTTPPAFRPIHLAYAVEKGRHAFIEKPVATDAPGVRSVLESCEKAKSKGLSIVAGLCWRYHAPRVETMKRVRDGAIGKLIAIETTYNSNGVWDPRKKREEVKSEMEYQMRNWYYYDWLSGDHIVEQAVHGIDTMGWAMGDVPPVRCWASGGRQVRTDARYGNIWDHFSVVYEYADGTRGYHNSRHWKNCEAQVKDYLHGAKGTCDVFGNKIAADTSWRYRGPNTNMYQAEHDHFFNSIRGGKAVNDGLFASRSTLLAIMGRNAAYTGQPITWEQALNSNVRLVPTEFSWGDLPANPIPKPGVTKLA
jgi:predicted dehydrogenase